MMAAGVVRGAGMKWIADIAHRDDVHVVVATAFAARAAIAIGLCGYGLADGLAITYQITYHID